MLGCERGTCNQNCGVARPAWLDDRCWGAVAELSALRQHLRHRVALAGAEVEDVVAGVGLHVVQRAQVGFAQVFDVDVVAHAGAIGRVVVVAKQFHGAGLRVERGFDDVGDEVGFGLVRFADFAIAVGAGGVEVAQADGAQAVGATVFCNLQLGHAFAQAVGVDGLGGMGFVDGAVLRVAINGGGG